MATDKLKTKVNSILLIGAVLIIFGFQITEVRIWQLIIAGIRAGLIGYGAWLHSRVKKNIPEN
jgi:VIT1/CCC1 family predicted Fe2+/Mn2+ transporter